MKNQEFVLQITLKAMEQGAIKAPGAGEEKASAYADNIANFIETLCTRLEKLHANNSTNKNWFNQ